MYQIYRGNFKCRWCDMAASTLDEKGLSYQVFELGMADLVQKWEETGMRTVPVIFQDHRLVGGCAELLEELKVNAQ